MNKFGNFLKNVFVKRFWLKLVALVIATAIVMLLNIL